MQTCALNEKLRQFFLYKEGSSRGGGRELTSEGGREGGSELTRLVQEHRGLAVSCYGN